MRPHRRTRPAPCRKAPRRGGGGTILNSAVTYFQSNIAADLGTLAVICIGIFLPAALDSISKALRP